MNKTHEIKQPDKKKARNISLVFHSMLVLLAFLWGCPYEPDKAQERQFHVKVNFQEPIEFVPAPSSNSNKAKSTEGAQKKKADPVAKIEDKKIEEIEVKKPDIKIPTPKPPTPPVIESETVIEEAEVPASDIDIEIEEIEIEDPSPDTEIEEVPDVIEVPKPRPKTGKKSTAPKSGKKDVPPSNKDGSGDGKGEQGDGKGADKEGNDGDSGVGTGGIDKGKYDGSGNGVFGRKVIYRNIKELLRVNFEGQKGKRIVVDFCVNNAGSVTYAEMNFDETTAQLTTSQMKQILGAFYGYKVEADYSAPSEQCGKMKVNLDEILTFR